MTLKEKAAYLYYARNDIMIETRNKMADRELAAEFEIKKPKNTTFEQHFEKVKIEKKLTSNEDAYEEILKSYKRTNRETNDKFKGK